MFKNLFKRRENDDGIVDPLYAEIVAQARHPHFYTEFAVPDTVDGRFDVLILHAILFFRRLKDEGDVARELSQRVFDTMFLDLDQNVRELGASDVTVGKKVKKMASAFYGRATAYDAAIEAYANKPEELQSVISRNIFTDTDVSPATIDAFARYVHRCAGHLASVSVDDIMTGSVSFAEPSDYDTAAGPT